MDGTLSAEDTLQLFLPTVYEAYRDSFTADYRHLLNLGRSPERAAREALAGTCQALCRKYVKSMLRHENFQHERQDAYGEALAAVANAARLFDPAAGVKFATYAGRSVIRDVGKYRDRVMRNGFSHTNKAVVRQLINAQQAEHGDWDGAFSDWFAHLFVDKHAADAEGFPSWDEGVWETITASIPNERWKEIFLMRYRQQTDLRAIYQRFDVSRGRIQQVLGRVLNLLAWKISNGYLTVPGQEKFLKNGETDLSAA